MTMDILTQEIETANSFDYNMDENSTDDEESLSENTEKTCDCGHSQWEYYKCSITHKILCCDCIQCCFICNKHKSNEFNQKCFSCDSIIWFSHKEIKEIENAHDIKAQNISPVICQECFDKYSIDKKYLFCEECIDK
jgi:hypothetical protein